MNDHNDEWISGTINLTVGGKPLELNLTVPANKVHPRKMLPVLQQLTNSFVALGIADEENAGRSVSCKAGCGACCRQLVPISQIEARNLSEIVAEMPLERQTEIRRRFAEIIEQLETADLLEKLREPDKFSDMTAQELGKHYFALGLACPFLENESCSIHTTRPLACREYLVTSPAENCAQLSAGTVRGVPIPAKVSNAVVLLSQPKSDSRFIPFVPLVLALEFAAETPDEMPSETGQNILKRVFANLK